MAGMDPRAPVGIGVTLLIVGIVWLVMRHKRIIRETWTQFGEKNGLTVTLGSYPKASGTIEGRSFSVASDMGRDVNGRPQMNAVVQFQLRVGLNGPVPPGLIAGKRGGLQKPGPVQLGDADFDRHCWVDCPDPAAARAYLTPERMAVVRKVAKENAVILGKTAKIEAMVAMTQTGYKTRLDWFEDLRQRFMQIAGELDG
jgi:hypothetical protein